MSESGSGRAAANWVVGLRARFLGGGSIETGQKSLGKLLNHTNASGTTPTQPGSRQPLAILFPRCSQPTDVRGRSKFNSGTAPRQLRLPLWYRRHVSSRRDQRFQLGPAQSSNLRELPHPDRREKTSTPPLER